MRRTTAKTLESDAVAQLGVRLALQEVLPIEAGRPRRLGIALLGRIDQVVGET